MHPLTATATPRTAVSLVIFDCDGVLVDSEPIAVRTHVAWAPNWAGR